MSSIGSSNRDENPKDQAPVSSESALTTSSDPKHTNFIMAHSNCPLCGSELELNHKIDSFGVAIKEEARCPHCQIRTRARNHTLQ
ncbi:MAG: hypothetical protein AB7O96_16735 [Pseudobdellovibrionaceae bacterium]